MPKKGFFIAMSNHEDIIGFPSGLANYQPPPAEICTQTLLFGRVWGADHGKAKKKQQES